MAENNILVKQRELSLGRRHHGLERVPKNKLWYESLNTYACEDWCIKKSPTNYCNHNPDSF